MVNKGTQSIVDFKENTITIDIDTNRVTESDRWQLRPLNPPLVCLSQIAYVHCFSLYTNTLDTSEFC